MNKIKYTIESNDHIKSSLFKIHDLNWYIKLYPCYDNNTVVATLILADCIYQQISIFGKISLVELQVQKCFAVKLGTWDRCNIIDVVLDTTLITHKQLLQLNSVSIKLEMEILPKYEINSNPLLNGNTLPILNYKHVIERPPDLICEWMINDSEHLNAINKLQAGHHLKSNIYQLNQQFEFIFWLYPKGRRRYSNKNYLSLFLNITKFPHHIYKIWLYCKFICKETLTEKIELFSFKSPENYWNGFAEFVSNDKLNALRKLNILTQFTFQVEITVIRALDLNYKPISINYNPIDDVLIENHTNYDEQLSLDERIKSYDVHDDLVPSTLCVSNKILINDTNADTQLKYVLQCLNWNVGFIQSMVEITRIDNLKKYPIYRIIFDSESVAKEVKTEIIKLNKKKCIDYNWYVLFWKNWEPLIKYGVIEFSDENNENKEMDKDTQMRKYDIACGLLKCTLNVSNKLLQNDNADKEFIDVLNKTDFDRNLIKEILRIDDIMKYPIYRIRFNNNLSAQNFKNRVIALNKKKMIDFNWFVSFWMNWDQLKCMRVKRNLIDNSVIKYNINYVTKHLNRDERIK
eukprot:274474_1